jgi:hypothetical protein
LAVWTATAVLSLGSATVPEASVRIEGTSPCGAGETRKAETIAPGLELLSIQRGEFAAVLGGDYWSIHVLIADPAKVRLGLGIALDEILGAEKTSSLSLRHGALAAVNGGYFRTEGLLKGEPAGLMALAGRVLSEPARGRASLAAAEIGGLARIAVAQIRIKGRVRTGNPAAKAAESRPIDGYNRDRGRDDLVVFTPEFHRTTLTDPSGAEAIVRGGAVVEVRDKAGSSIIPADGFVVSGRGAAAEWIRTSLRPRTAVRIQTEIEAEPALPFEPDFLIGGGPRLLRAGRTVPSEAEAFPGGFYASRHPRTAIGLRADGRIVLATVDGRQPGLSVGMTIAELAGLMAELRCVEALNLDGGGSTTMVVKGKVVNSPSDPAGERAVSDAILLFGR